MLQSPFFPIGFNRFAKVCLSISVLPTGRIWICLFCIYIPCTINVFCPSISPFSSLVLYRNSIQFCFPVLIHNRCLCECFSVRVCMHILHLLVYSWFTFVGFYQLRYFFPFSAFPWKSHHLQQFIFVLSTLDFAFGIFSYFLPSI